jgi:hypothetical protein
MARGRRRNIIQSREEYLLEELVGQKSYQQTYASSNLDPSTDEYQLDRKIIMRLLLQVYTKLL